MTENQNLEAPQQTEPNTINVEKKTNSNFGTPQAIVVAGLLIAVAIFLKLPGGGTLGSSQTNNKFTYAWQVKPVETAPNNHWLGDEDAEIVLVEYSDTECPFCKNFHKTMHQVIDNYKGEVAWVYKHLPLESLHRLAKSEAIAAECAEELGGNVIFWRYLDAIFETTTSNDGLPPEMLHTIAKALKLNSADFTSCLENPDIAAQVDADVAEVNALTDRIGTPYTVIKKNGEIVDTITGALPYATIIEKIEAVKNK